MTHFVKKEALRFAIDFDGVLTEDRRWLTTKVIEYFGVDRLHNIHKKMSSEYLSITDEMNVNFWHTFWEDFESLPICPDAIHAIRRLHELGHSIDCLTARGSYLDEEYQANLRVSTLRRIRMAGIPFDKVVFDSNKAERMEYDVIIDDDPCAHFVEHPIRRTPVADWKLPFQHQICFGYHCYSVDWMGDRIANFWELEALYPDLFSTRIKV